MDYYIMSNREKIANCIPFNGFCGRCWVVNEADKPCASNPGQPCKLQLAYADDVLQALLTSAEIAELERGGRLRVQIAGTTEALVSSQNSL